ncbi:MAG: diversity-generating retroelement protein Avd [Chloroflexi bacterium]|nr:diversity-generating retroelement protein Avd [Chloroflexota bacterium]
MKQSPLFSKTYDFVAWVIPVTVKFPRYQRFVMAAALQHESLHFQELIIEAAHKPDPDERLTDADAELDKIRTHVRLCLEMDLLEPGQYQHAAGLLTEMGNLLGGWIKKSRSVLRKRQAWVRHLRRDRWIRARRLVEQHS